MTTAAAAPAPTAPATTAEAAPVPAEAAANAAPAEAEAKEESPDRRLDAQISRALKKGRAALKAKEGVPPRGEGGKFTKRAAEAVDGGESDAGDAAAATEEPAKAPVATAGKTPRELLDAGELEAAFEAAFGKKPQDFKIDSRRWEEWRKAGARQKRDLESQRTAAIEEVSGHRRQLHDTLEAAKKAYGPMVEAKKLFDSGDVIGAVRSAFGIELNDLQKRALAQFHGKNPEVEQLRRELAERDANAKKRDEEAAEQARQSREREQTTAYLEGLQQTLIDGSDPEIAGLATKPRFIQRVFQIQRQHYDPATKTSLPAQQAAAMARDEIVTEFGGVFGKARDTAVPVESAQPGSKAAKAKATTSLPQRGAAEAGPPGRRLTAQEQVNKYTELARAEAGLS